MYTNQNFDITMQRKPQLGLNYVFLRNFLSIYKKKKKIKISHDVITY